MIKKTLIDFWNRNYATIIAAFIVGFLFGCGNVQKNQEQKDTLKTIDSVEIVKDTCV